MKEFLSELKKEWKTFGWGVIWIAITGWDMLVSSGLNFFMIIPEQYRPFAMFMIPFGFFLLRKWVNK